MRTIRIGSGAGYSGDRIDPAVELAEKGTLSYLAFECLAERTIALAQKARLSDPSAGFDPLLEERMEAVLPLCARNRIRVVSNMGAANPVAAMIKTRDVARRLGLNGLRIAAITGDDVLSLVREEGFPLHETGRPAASLGDRLLSANAYLGAEPIVAALQANADIVLTGRVSDPSLFLAPLLYEFGWSTTDWNLMGQGTVIGHLLECAGQITGGYFADPGFKEVPNLAHLGFPLAEVSEDGSAVITKVDGSGGMITRATCTEQMLYEIQNPAAYLTPDVVADLSHVTLEDAGTGCVKVMGGRGHRRPDTLKVSVGFHDGYLGEGQISYAGPGARSRAELARAILKERLTAHPLDELRFDLIGIDSIHGDRLSQPACDPWEVRLRAAGRSSSRRLAAMVLREVEALYTNGPFGGGGVSGSTQDTVGILTAFVPRDKVHPKVHMEVS